jgi:hypothetical protein
MSPRDRRALIIFGAVTLVAVAVFFLFIAKGPKKVVSGSGGPRVIVTQPTPSPSPTKAKKQREVLVFSGRDPFDPAQGGGSAAVPAGAGAVSNPGSSQAPGGGSSKQVGGKTVVLVDIFTEGNVQKAQVEVDGTVYTVAEGDSFDDGFKLVSISGSCADFTHNSTSFTLCQVENK